MIKAPYIYYKEKQLMMEEVRVEDIIKETGTPTYLYSKGSLLNQLKQLKEAFGNTKLLICYSMKVCHNINIANVFVENGCGVDIVSGGELYRAIKAGADPKKIVYSGVAKTEKEIREAIEADILMFNVESEQELTRINNIAASKNKKVSISLRINPGVDAKTHPYITTGMKENKFGIDSEMGVNIYKKAMQMEHVEVIGIDLHIGSQLLDVAPYGEAMKIVADYVRQLRSMNIPIQYVDIGGGIGIPYKEEQASPDLNEYARLITEPFQDMPDITFVLEPGRFLVAQAGLLITEVQYIKDNSYDKRFVIIDSGMHHLIRPSLYQSYHNIIPVIQKEKSMNTVDVVGPICESTDFLAKDRQMEEVTQGDLLAVTDAGAYGIVMSSHYNSHSRPVEVLVEENDYKIIRRRETYEDLLSGEII
ncbi:diaminopimelate decarboxylase [Mobilitalea sibirica]|uniref:Diaminopimelate decarboxylase n=1 Tax=Mobilitalea sibirica TaxID=1462919 RepID=A0A8J7HBD5_9FIRM|nr:diaminopimelate decarboxylase [Mobilitalea sibirica]MBH1940961.1 diaminopimelate decarboxylase [Mobilitalea sibirica]